MRTQDARSIHINEYLSRIGAKLARTQLGTHGMEYVYHSPTRNDAKPSLCVNLDRNIWSDVPVGEGGRLIELVCYLHDLHRNDVSGALSILDQVFPEYRDTGHTSRALKPSATPAPVYPRAAQGQATGLKEDKVELRLKSVKAIYRYALKDYLTKERKISLGRAGLYLKEVEFERGTTSFFALGFPCGDTYALRNKNFKGFLGRGPKPSIFEKHTSELLLFEGVFDFLTYLETQKRDEAPLTAVVLNSTAFLPRFCDYLREQGQVTRVYCYLDRDFAGMNTVNELRLFFPRIDFSDRSELYQGFKDFNEWWCAQ